MMLSKLFPSWIAAKMMSLDQEIPPSLDIHSPCLPILLTISTTFDTPSSPLLLCRITVDGIFNTPDAWYSDKHWISTTQSLTTVQNPKGNVMPSCCRHQSSQMLMRSRFCLYQSASGPRTPVLESANGQQNRCGFGRIGVAWQHNG